MHRWIGGFENLTKTQNRIRKDEDLRALKTDDLFITNQRQVFPWIIFPINCLQSIDLILFRHQFCRHVEHFFHCEIFCTLDGLTIVQVILSHEYRWFQCYSHEHSPNHRMFLSIFCNIWNSFLYFPHLVIHPIHEWSWFYRQFQFCCIASHDEILRSCHLLRIDITRSPRSVTGCFSVPYGLRGSVEKNFLVIRSNFSVPFSKKFSQVAVIDRTS